ncbi:MAG: hypothetical protein KJ941_07130 [Bacteroidetes bacterium]|nr:hypothetical protein [Bacteroidota bacterium]
MKKWTLLAMFFIAINFSFGQISNKDKFKKFESMEKPMTSEDLRSAAKEWKRAQTNKENEWIRPKNRFKDLPKKEILEPPVDNRL